jgi:hypothetical protein
MAVDSEKIRWVIEGKMECEISSGPLVKIFTARLALGNIPEAWQRVRVFLFQN